MDAGRESQLQLEVHDGSGDDLRLHRRPRTRSPDSLESFGESLNEVDKVLPDFGERKEWLRVNGAGMNL